MASVSFGLFTGLDDGLQRVLDLRREQHGLIASNLANVDTPGWTAKEIDFSDVLSRVVDGAEAGDPMPEVTAESIPADVWSVDGNSVSAEHEAAKLTENSVMYNALAAGLGRRLAMLRYAASDGKG